MRCLQCGYEREARSLRQDEFRTCPKCGSVPSMGVEPLPPKIGRIAVPTCGPCAWKTGGFLVVACVMVSVGYFALDTPRGPSVRGACRGRLSDIARALHIYHDTYGALPAQSTTDEDGRPMHSWRVAILPIIEQKKLYDAYDFDRPWDSPHNSALCETYIETFCCPGTPINDEDVALTNYFVVSGDETMFGPNRWTRFSDVTDELANTIMVVECDSPDFRVKWYEPRDISYGEMEFKLNPSQGIGVSSPHIDGANVAMGDGSVRFIANDSVGESTLRYLLLRGDGMPAQVP